MKTTLLLVALLSIPATVAHAHAQVYHEYDSHGIYQGYSRVNPHTGAITTFDAHNVYKNRLTPSPFGYNIYDNRNRYQGRITTPTAPRPAKSIR